jgi:hypothetical protein
MHPPTGPLESLHSPEQRPVSAHAAHKGLKGKSFHLLPPRGQFTEMGEGGVDGENSVDLRVGRLVRE